MINDDNPVPVSTAADKLPAVPPLDTAERPAAELAARRDRMWRRERALDLAVQLACSGKFTYPGGADLGIAESFHIFDKLLAGGED